MNLKTGLLSLATLVAIGIIMLFLWDDDSLDPAVERALELPERLPLESNLFYPLAGFAVAEGDDSAEEGYAAVTRVNELLHAHDGGEVEEIRSKIQKAWVESVLEIEDPTKIVCAPKEDGCIAELWTRRTDLMSLAGEHQTLIARFRRLAGFPGYQMDLQPHVEMPLPRFDAVLSTHRLTLGIYAVGYLQGEDAHLGAILNDLRFSRRLLGQADNLLTKMVAADMLADALHAYAVLMDREGSNLDRFPVLAPLSAAEVSLESSLLGEFRFVSSALSGVQREAVNYEDLGLPRWLDAAGLRPLFKPKRTLNNDFSCWQVALAIARLSPGELVTHGTAKDTPACKPSWYEWVVNPIGMFFSSISRPDFRRYAGRLHNLDGLITLVNLKRSLRQDRVALDDVAGYLIGEGAKFVDPYTEKTMQWDADTRTLRFTGAEPHIGYERLPLEPLRAKNSG